MTLPIFKLHNVNVLNASRLERTLLISIQIKVYKMALFIAAV